ncbi:MAG: DUF2156 domain-containing protein [Geobacter sp.]|nr:DUF2156 domain-containing protein [Geobacter sp.]
MNSASPIPQYPASRPMELADKERLDPLFAELQPAVSELTFAGLFLFRQAHDYRLTLLADALVVLGKGYDGDAYFLPPLSGDVAAALDILFGSGLILYGADEPFVSRYLADTGLKVLEDRDAFDYLYLRSELAELSGNRFHKKKNRLNYFASRHDFTVEIFRPTHLDGALRLLAEWQRVRGSDDNRSAVLEASATAEGLQLAAVLGLEGVTVLVEGAVAAFALGERLNRETSVCHFEKSDPFMEGISQLVDQQFNSKLFTDCLYVNREQDLGEPGLRTAKLSYHPVKLVRKFRAWRIL